MVRLQSNRSSISVFSELLLSYQAGVTFPQIEERFSIGIEVATLSISLYILGMGIGPLFFGGLSEFLGRNLIYRTSFLAFVLLTFPVAFAPNAGMSIPLFHIGDNDAISNPSLKLFT